MLIDDALDHFVRDIKDWPEEGVTFRDLTPLMAEPAALRTVIDTLVAKADGLGPIDKVVGLEARGFIFGPPVALALGVGFVPVRKAGKLPADTHEISYDLEYGQATVQIHRDAITPGERVLVIDDVLATGGTLAAAHGLIEHCGGDVAGSLVILEIAGLAGRDKLRATHIESMRSI